jgi:hypothetical protein
LLIIQFSRLGAARANGFLLPPFPPLIGVAHVGVRGWCDLSGRRWQQSIGMRVGIAAPMPL